MQELEDLLTQETALMQRHYRHIGENTGLLKQMAIDNYYLYRHQVRKTLILINLYRRDWPAG